MSFFRKAGSDSSSSEEESDEELLSDQSDTEQAPKVSQSSPLKKSRFARDSGDSESDSDDSDQDEDEAEPAQAAAPVRGSRFMRGAASDDSDASEDEGKRVVRSAKSKRAEELEMGAKRVENALKIDDWVTVNSEFDKMTRLVISSPANILAVVTIPPVYLKLLSSLDDAVKAQAQKQKKLNAIHSKALNGIKQKLKKTQREYEDHINKYQADPEQYERDFEGVPIEPTQPRQRRQQTAADAGDEDFTTVGRGGKALSITPENVLKTLQQVLEARGKKATDRAEQVKILEKLLAVAATPYAKIRVFLALISSLFDYNQSSHNYLPLEQWAAARTRIDELLDLLDTEKDYTIAEETEEYDEMEERAPAKDEQTGHITPLKVRGSVLSAVEKLDDEFTRSLKDIDPHAIEYVDRLKDENKLYSVLARAATYFEVKDLQDNLDRAVVRRLDHVYGKPDAVIDFLEASLPPLQSSVWTSPSSEKAGEGNLVRALCVHLYKPKVDPRLRSKAVLCHVFHHALHNDFYRARDQLLMSHVHYSVTNMDVDTQILYNRTIAELGLSAFRNGLIEECEAMLRDLYSNPTLVRERLAQGMQRRAGPDYAVSPEQEKLEKARQVPFHQHINLELLEVAYLISSMLVEVPQIALEDYDPERKRDIKSRMFRRQLDSFDKQIFAGPPENKREHVVQGAKALQAGDWRKCIELVEGIKVWNLMPGEKQVKTMLAQRIQEEALRTYLYSHAAFYTTISLQYLSSTFELPLTNITSLVASMIWNEQISGSLSLNTETLVLHRESRSALQQMALSLADKIQQALGENERTANLKFGEGDGARDGQRGDRQQGDGQRRNGGERRPQRGGHSRGRGRGIASFTSGIGRAVRA